MQQLINKIHNEDCFKALSQIPDNLRYSITPNGAVWDSRNKRQAGVQITYKGYLKAALWKNGKRNWRFVHRLVALTFISNPENKPQVNHKDGNKLNNHISNLEWCTNQENSQHVVDNGFRIIPKGKDNWASKAVICLETSAIYYSIKEAAENTNSNPNAISMVCLGKRRKAGGLHWKFKESKWKN